jgi:hypothetical protein
VFFAVVLQTPSFSDLVSEAVSGRCLHQTPIEALCSFIDFRTKR